MDKTDFTFMKSGFEPRLDKEPDKDSLLAVASLVATFSENAMESAEKYVEHAGRKNITDRDISACLKAETFRFIHRKDNEEKFTEWKNIIRDDIENNDEIIEINEEEDEEYSDEEYTQNTCKCEECNFINTILKNWDSWEPKNDMEKILKDAIDIASDLE